MSPHINALYTEPFTLLVGLFNFYNNPVEERFLLFLLIGEAGRDSVISCKRLDKDLNEQTPTFNCFVIL